MIVVVAAVLWDQFMLISLAFMVSVLCDMLNFASTAGGGAGYV